jgi:hypothetical protein
MKNKTKEFLLTLLSCFAAIASAVCSIGSRKAANNANVISENMLLATDYANSISKRTLEIEENRKLNENKEKSVKILSDLYDKFMYTP